MTKSQRKRILKHFARRRGLFAQQNCRQAINRLSDEVSRTGREIKLRSEGF